jgi:rubredoxin
MGRPTDTSGYCRQCGYSLHGLSPTEADGSAPRWRCPECGRGFDPENPKSFARHRHGRILNWLASPVGWPAVVIMLVAAGGALCVSRWRLTVFTPTVGLWFYLEPGALRQRTNLLTWRDCLFTAAMLAAIAAMAWWIVRSIIGALARWRWGELRPDQAIHLGRRRMLMGLGTAIVAAGAAMGWPYLLAQKWIARRRQLGPAIPD